MTDLDVFADDASVTPSDERLIRSIERIGRNLDHVLIGVIVIAALLAGILIDLIL